jgi:hypothetical protein
MSTSAIDSPGRPLQGRVINSGQAAQERYAQGIPGLSTRLVHDERRRDQRGSARFHTVAIAFAEPAPVGSAATPSSNSRHAKADDSLSSTATFNGKTS